MPPPLEYHLFGAGPEEEALRRRAAERGVADLVKFHGFVEYGPELISRLAEYDLLYYSTVLSVDGMNLPAADGVLVAGLANGQLAYLDRRKASGHYEDERERTESQAG